ncbi:MAG: hypothetical protein WAR37_03530 [Candidatus Microsaccharimonas sp.]
MAKVAELLYTSRYRALEHEAAKTPLLFRRNAAAAYRSYPKPFRRESAQLEGEHTTAVEFYEAWKSRFLPDAEIITGALLDRTLKLSFKKRFLLDDMSTEKALKDFIEKRLNDLTTDFLNTYYKPYELTARKAARSFLQTTREDNEVSVERYIEYSLYKMVARENRMTIVDRHAGAIRRLIQIFRRNVEVRKFIRMTRRQAKNIRRTMTNLETQDNGLISALFALQIDLITIRASYQAYEKSLEKLSAAQRKNPSKRLALYEKETADIRKNHLNALSGVESLRDIQQSAKEIDAVLLRVFDLSNRQYNELMTRLKEYRELRTEHVRLLTMLK